MDAKVIKPFFDLSNPDDVYAIGDTFSGTAERVNGLIQKGFLEPLELEPEPKPEKKPAPKKKSAKKSK
jgi:hypothetical protein